MASANERYLVRMAGKLFRIAAHMVFMVKTRSEYNSYMKTYMLDRYQRLMKEARESLGGKCVVCGVVEGLEMDHINPSEKLFAISHGRSKKPEEFWAEVAKCQLLCRDHHNEKTAREKSVEHGEGASGKKNCPCDKCKAKKAEYMKNYQAERKEMEEQLKMAA